MQKYFIGEKIYFDGEMYQLTQKEVQKNDELVSKGRIETIKDKVKKFKEYQNKCKADVRERSNHNPVATASSSSIDSLSNDSLMPVPLTFSPFGGDTFSPLPLALDDNNLPGNDTVELQTVEEGKMPTAILNVHGFFSAGGKSAADFNEPDKMFNAGKKQEVFDHPRFKQRTNP